MINKYENYNSNKQLFPEWCDVKNKQHRRIWQIARPRLIKMVQLKAVKWALGIWLWNWLANSINNYND